MSLAKSMASDVLERLAEEMYTRDLSTRDIEDSFREAQRAGNSFASFQLMLAKDKPD